MNTSLCYIENGGYYLMLHRTKKENDINRDKWLGVGGKFKNGETPYECARREIYEETAINPEKLNYRGIITFVTLNKNSETEYMHLFTSTVSERFVNTSCDEGELVWIRKSEVCDLPIWEGDKIFFKLLDTEKRFFSLKLVYDDDKLVAWELEHAEK